MELLKIEKLCKNYGDKQVLKDVDLTIPRGRIIGLLGKNGMGKSTLIKLINDLLTPTSGTILVNGEKIGQFGLLHPSVVLAKKQIVGALELDFAKLCAMEEKVLKVKKPSKYQCSKLDFNFVVDKDVACGQVEEYFKEFRCKFDVEFVLKDIYINEKEMPNKIRILCNL